MAATAGNECTLRSRHAHAESALALTRRGSYFRGIQMNLLNYESVTLAATLLPLAGYFPLAWSNDESKLIKASLLAFAHLASLILLVCVYERLDVKVTTQAVGGLVGLTLCSSFLITTFLGIASLDRSKIALLWVIPTCVAAVCFIGNVIHGFNNSEM